MKRYLPFVIVIAVLLIAVGAGALLFRSHHHRQQQQRQQQHEKATSTLALPGAEPPHVRGPVNAPVTLEEFGDFECFPCGNLSPILEKLEIDYGARLRVIFRQFPMANHRRAFRAACAAEAAGLQGRFWEMHDRLYQERFAWPATPDVEKSLESYARDLGLDVDRFKKDMESEEVKGRIAADQKRAASLGVDRTPTLFINNRLVPPTSFNPDGLRQAVEAALHAESR